MKLRTGMLLMCFILLISGCASNAAFIYEKGNTVNVENNKLPYKIAVMPLEDKRGHDNTNMIMLYLIPVVPFGTLNYDRPDAANGFVTHASYNARPSEDIAKAVVDELNQNKFFDEVFFSQREKEPNIDMLMTGELREMKYDAKLITYGLSVEGPLLWFVGLPSSNVNNYVDFSLQLKRVSDGMVVWKHDVKGEWNKTAGLYYNWGTEFDGFPIIIREGLVEGMKKIASQMKETGNNTFKK